LLNKSTLRARSRKIKLPTPEERELFSRVVCNLIAKEDAFKKATNVGLYVARPNEIDLTPLWFLNREACAFPRVTGNHEMQFFTIEKMGDLTSGYKGILEPPADPARRILEWTEEDLILVPALAFDLWGNRLGSGLGFYDRFLGEFAKKTPKWGVCFNEQVLLEQIPTGEFDIAMDAICTPHGFRRR